MVASEVGGGGSGDVEVAGGVEGEGEADVAGGSDLGLGEDVGGGGVGLEEADAVFLIEEEVEVAGRVGLDGVELALIGDGAEAGEDELLGVLGCAGLRRRGCRGRRGGVGARTWSSSL